MSVSIRIKRGLEANLPSLGLGELAYTTDTNKLFIGVNQGTEQSPNIQPVLINDLSALNDAMIFKGTLGTSGTFTSLPTTHDVGWTIKVITAGTYAGKVAEIGDMYISLVSREGNDNADTDWALVQANIDGAVVGPSSSTNNALTVFNGTTGKLVKNSTFIPTTIGGNLINLANPSAIRFPQFNADNTVSSLTAADFRTAIGAGTSSTTGTVTSVAGTGTVSGLTLSGTVTTSGNLTLGGTLSVAGSNFGSQTANTFLGAPNGSNGNPTFRALVPADIPTLNQNTTGTATNVTGTVAITNGGTGATTAATARTNLGAAPTESPTFSGQVTLTPTTLANSGTVPIDFAGATYRTQGPLTNHVTYSGSNYANGRSVTIRVINGSQQRTLAFPAGWRFLGDEPANIAANKLGVLTLASFGSSESDVIAAWAVEL